MARVVVIGAGTMGLAAAYQAVRDGHEVHVLEGASTAGGMAAHFDFGGLSIERFYHFVTRGDAATFALLGELGLGDRLRWVPTSMGLFCDGRLHPWGDPLSMLRFPGLGLVSKLRYGLMCWLAVRRERWPGLDALSAKEWIVRWCGLRVYEKLWRPLLALKFYEYQDRISAAWVGARIQRVGRSRRSLMQEELGYIDGGSQVLVDALVEAIVRGGGQLHLATPARRVEAEQGHVRAVLTPKGTFAADAVLCTVPTPLVSRLVPALPEDCKARYERIVNIGVCCLVFKLARSVTPNLWTNISEPGIDVPGIIEFSNLRPLSPHIVYVPYYMPITHPRFAWPDEALLDEAFGYLRRINPALRPEDRLDARVGRLRHAQPVCETGFGARLPPVQTPIRGLQIADTSFYYPMDRCIALSVQLGREMARAVPLGLRRPERPDWQPLPPRAEAEGPSASAL